MDFNAVDYDGIENELGRYLSTKEGYRIPQDRGGMGISEGSKVIYVFGASSVVVSNGYTFAKFLQAHYGNRVDGARVYNFGYGGIDSFAIKLVIQDVLESIPVMPDVIIIYMGHNDYNNAYQSIVTSAFPEFSWLVRLVYPIAPNKRERVIGPMSHRWFWRLRRGQFYDGLQKLKVARLDEKRFAQYDDMILGKFADNLQDVLTMVTGCGIPVVLITPIGNLEARPFGPCRVIDEFFELGTAADEYEGRIENLTMARDAEVFTFDVRARSDLNEYLRTIDMDRVFLLDLEMGLRDVAFEFSDEDFLDYFHLRERTHKLIAERLIDLIDRDL